MITQYRFEVDNREMIPSFKAYRIYSWMQEQISSDYADALHMPEETPVSQYLYYDKTLQKNIWVINLLNNDSEEIFSPVLQSLKEIPLHGETLIVNLSETAEFKSPESFIQEARKEKNRFKGLEFITPAAFKSDSKYVIFPSEKLIIQSLVNRWNVFIPEYPIDDREALKLLENGITISDYALRTRRFRLKNVKIPGFTGKILFNAKCSAPIAELWQMLLYFSAYSGTGIKTALGMGATAPVII